MIESPKLQVRQELFELDSSEHKVAKKRIGKRQEALSDAAGTMPFRTLVIDEPFALELGRVLGRLEIRFETWGHLNFDRDNAVLLCPAFSASSHARSHSGNPQKGWWEKFIGPGCALDTDKYFIICPSLLGGSNGTTGPHSIDPTTGFPYGANFPTISVIDIVRVHVRLLDFLGIEKLHAVIGGSLGAMEALELAIRHKGRAARVLAISGTDRTRPYTAAIRYLGREAILMAERLGDRREGLKLARKFATLFYRSADEFNQRFHKMAERSETQARNPFIELESYLAYHGKKALTFFDTYSYLTLSLAMDLHNIWQGFSSPEQALDSVESCFLIAGIREDHLISADEQEELHQTLLRAGKSSEWRCLSSRVGHDAFLVEHEMVNQLLEDALNQSP